MEEPLPKTLRFPLTLYLSHQVLKCTLIRQKQGSSLRAPLLPSTRVAAAQHRYRGDLARRPATRRDRRSSTIGRNLHVVAVEGISGGPPFLARHAAAHDLADVLVAAIYTPSED